MKITIIAPFAFGYPNNIISTLNKTEGVNARIIYLDKPGFKYKNLAHKLKNFMSKIFGKNLKKTYVFDRIKSEVSKLANQDQIFIIRPDVLDNATLKFLKTKTANFTAYYWDSTRRFPRKTKITNYFDTIYSYDKQDVEQYGFKTLTNYIFAENTSKAFDYLFFNISTNDHRFSLIENLAGYLKQYNWSYTIKVYNGTPFEAEHVEPITTQLSISEVEKLILKSKIIVEIQRNDQIGLSFRIFEALGYRKKLITTNTDVVNYDFYNPQNILVIDEHNITIPEEFVTSPYVDIDETILDKYRLENWVKPIFNLQ
jgi:hypothetical protein